MSVRERIKMTEAEQFAFLAEEKTVSVAQFRQLDQDHMERCQAVHAAGGQAR